ncbi:conjugal transfer protein TrbL [Pectobacterium brasiliense]|uniref:type IV secretion system protein n=1 Tax=Pectobacterium brasiliense TaxID=180957 RepID=UPI0001A44EFC|nr:type IV secretion system protein [Pectobacterium brasiliense]KGA21929.1 conjugal transfer protein TrbL [Pectobacterium brasiliense]KRF63704.1 conjugal transfer protein TrbL [Pectobacterium brasiliense]MBN3184458.1 type IV secretion system protein [Pectobacterium brasiliense]MBN3185567.1 type IV secretion system protein [Pectobacterium brasiliense]QHG30328.1 conjugal transfer protein TrbL [Pectobacterium brasiliense]
MSGGMFVGMNNTITDGLHAVLRGQTSVYGDMVSVIAVSSFTLFVTYRGYQTLAGKLQTPVEDVIWDVGRMLLIMTFVLNLDGWLDLAISSINGLTDGVSGDDNVWVLLDTVWAKAQTIGQKLYQQDDSTYVKLNGGIAQLLVWGGAIVTLLFGSAVNLLAGIIIVLMTTTAPLFIFCLLYGFLIPMFNNWLKIIFTVILTIMFSALSIRIVINYLNGLLDKAVNFADSANIITLGVQCCVAGVISGVIIWFSAKIANALGGVAVQAALQGAAMGGLRGLAKPSSDVAKPVMKAGATGARLATKAGVSAATATGSLIAAGTSKALSAWQKRAASIDSMKRFNQQRNR